MDTYISFIIMDILDTVESFVKFHLTLKNSIKLK